MQWHVKNFTSPNVASTMKWSNLNYFFFFSFFDWTKPHFWAHNSTYQLINLINTTHMSRADFWKRGFVFPYIPWQQTKISANGTVLGWVSEVLKCNPDLATISGVNMSMSFHFSVHLLFLLTSVSSSLSLSPVLYGSYHEERPDISTTHQTMI